jgi:hypothetical protein
MYLTALVYERERPHCKLLLQKEFARGKCRGVVGLLHEEARDSSRMDHDKSNRGGKGRKGIDSGNAIIAPPDHYECLGLHAHSVDLQKIATQDWLN